MDSVTANGVLLTRENLLKVGAFPPIIGQDWVIALIAGVETAIPLTAPTTIAGSYWDPVSQVALALTLAIDADQVTNPGLFTIKFIDTILVPLVAGMCRFQIDITDTVAEIRILCKGWLEILAARPEP